MKLLSSLILVASAVATLAATPPNIIVFLVDDMGVMDTSVPFLTDKNGAPEKHPLNSFYRTPSMEKLAGRGIRFSQFQAMSVCSPTRTSIMTGQNSARHHVTNWIDPGSNNKGPHGPPDWDWKGLGTSDVTLPRLLAASGYETIHVGKGHFGPKGSPGADPRSIGFSVNIGGGPFGSPGSYYGKQNYSGKGGANAVPGLDAYHGGDVFLTEALTLEANKRIAGAASAGRPFFLYLAHYAVHAPFDSDPRFAKNYADSGKSAQARAFATLIEGMDKSLGDVLEQLDKSGVAENTLIFFLGDNGSDSPLGGPHEIACSAPLRGKKGSHYEGGTRVPFIAAWAKPNPANPAQQAMPILAGEVQTQPASVCDIFPTITRLVGIGAPKDYAVDGVALQPALAKQRDASRTDELLLHYPHAPHRSDYFSTLRKGDWKVAYHYLPAKTGPRYQLFDLASDPSESHDLADSRPEKLREMMKHLVSSLEAHKAQYPVDDAGQPIEPVIP